MNLSESILNGIRGEMKAEDFNATIERHLDKQHSSRLIYNRYRPLYWAVFLVSFVLNGLSATTASTLEFDFAEHILKNTTLALCLTAATFILIELTKRYLLFLIFDDIEADGKCDKPGLIVAAVLLSVTVTTMAFFGAGELVQRTATPPALVAADVADLDAQITKANTAIEQASKNRNAQGEIYFLSQKNINQQTEHLENLQEERNRRVQKSEEKNESILKAHGKEVDALSWNFGWVTLGCELALPACIWFLMWYRHASRREFAKLKSKLALPDEEEPDDPENDEWRIIRNYSYGQKKTVETPATVLQQANALGAIAHFSKVSNEWRFYTREQVQGMMNEEDKRAREYKRQGKHKAEARARDRFIYWQQRLEELQVA